MSSSLKLSSPSQLTFNTIQGKKLMQSKDPILVSKIQELIQEKAFLSLCFSKLKERGFQHSNCKELSVKITPLSLTINVLEEGEGLTILDIPEGVDLKNTSLSEIENVVAKEEVDKRKKLISVVRMANNIFQRSKAFSLNQEGLGVEGFSIEELNESHGRDEKILASKDSEQLTLDAHEKEMLHRQMQSEIEQLSGTQARRLGIIENASKEPRQEVDIRQLEQTLGQSVGRYSEEARWKREILDLFDLVASRLTQLDFLQENLNEKSQESRESKALLGKKEREVEDLKKESKALLGKKEREVEDLKKESKALLGKKEREVEDLKKELKGLQKELLDLKTELTSFKNTSETDTTLYSKDKNSTNKLSNELKSLNEKFRKLLSEKKQLSLMNNEGETTIKSLKAEIRRLYEHFTAEVNRLSAFQMKLISSNAKCIEELEKEKEFLEGIFKGKSMMGLNDNAKQANQERLKKVNEEIKKLRSLASQQPKEKGFSSINTGTSKNKSQALRLQ